MKKDILSESLTFSNIYASSLKNKKKHTLVFKFSDAEEKHHQSTRYYSLKCIDCNIIITSGKISGNYNILLPLATLNRMINKNGDTNWFENNWNNYIEIIINKINKYDYKLISKRVV
jgi:hypothetical protein